MNKPKLDQREKATIARLRGTMEANTLAAHLQSLFEYEKQVLLTAPHQARAQAFQEVISILRSDP